MGSTLNPIAVRTAKTLWSFGRSECNRSKKMFIEEHIVSLRCKPPMERRDKTENVELFPFSI